MKDLKKDGLARPWDPVHGQVVAVISLDDVGLDGVAGLGDDLWLQCALCLLLLKFGIPGLAGFAVSFKKLLPPDLTI